MARRMAKVAVIILCCVTACSASCLAIPTKSPEFAEIDRRVSDTPKSAGTTVQSLAACLGKLCKTDLEKSRAIFDWITLNIDYDGPSARTGNYADQTAAHVMQTRKAVCGGYAYLFAALADAMHLKQITVVGQSKGLTYVIGEKSSKNNHAWNAVMVDGQWQLIDCAWGAGYLSNEGKFVRCRNEHYFLTPPEQFVYDHFPEQPKWQLLDKPLGESEYQSLVYLRPESFAAGIKPLSHPHAQISCDSRTTITLEAPKDVILTADVLECVKRDEIECKCASTFIQRCDGQLQVSASFPSAGKYLLRLYAKRKAEAGAYQWVADYCVNASSGTAGKALFPAVYSTFMERDAFLNAPMKAALIGGATESFKLSVPGAESVAVMINDEYCRLEKTGDIFEGQAEISGSKVSVAAKFPDGRNYYVLLDYDVIGKASSSAK